MDLCGQFIINNTCSSGRCICGREKWEHSKKKQYEHIFYDEGMKRASQHNFNQAEAGYNAKWFKRGAVFGAKWQSEKSDEYTISFTEWIIEKELFYSLQYGRIETSELLLMFKKEKGL